MKVLLLALVLTTQPSCSVIMSYVWTYGETAAMIWAKANGFSDAEIAALRKRCIKVKP